MLSKVEFNNKIFINGWSHRGLDEVLQTSELPDVDVSFGIECCHQVSHYTA